MGADLVLENGHIVTLDDEMREHQAIAMKNGRILELDTSKIPSLISDETKVIDLDGKTVLPGFIDAHQHMIQFGYKLLCVDCNLESISDVVSAIENKAKSAEPDEWIIGLGFNEANFKENRMLHREDFTHIENPVMITRYCYHAAVVNQKALIVSEINESTVNPEGGEIVKDNFNRLTGELREKALDIVKASIPPLTDREIEEAIFSANNFYLTQGITAVHEAGMGHLTGELKEFRLFQKLSLNGSLDIRVYGMVLDQFFNEVADAKLVTGFGNQKLRLGSIKFFSDGTISGQTASISENYSGSDSNRGMMMMPNSELKERIIAAHKEGFQVAVHAIGDKAIELVLIAYEEALELYPRKDHRHRIEHCGIVTPEIIKRMKKLHVIPVPQPAFIYLNGDVYMDVLPDKLKNLLYPAKTFIEEGLKPAGSSDCPVITSSVLLGISSAMSRATRNGNIVSSSEQVTLVEAIEMYTKNAAYAAFEENEVGTIEIGKRGDLTILPPNFMTFSAEEVRETNVEMTVIEGDIKFTR
ncbi:amidohydrolase [Virgibacillus sp. C22-A2]|uniref:Amidohydrolase n=1 Tax=Virgibacillus tibetensis TaxID=3042313 RepID=A0ABU6KD58_9BACI|nr:amidohydrolase [Virgibacillus sp. C22-A2]